MESKSSSKMLILKPIPPWFETYTMIITLMAFWWFCRLCSTMKTLCDMDVCQCDNAYGKISCICKYPDEKLEISQDGINQLSSITTSVFVKGCDNLMIRGESFEKLRDLVRINIVNVKNISLENKSFSWNESTYRTSYGRGIDINIENSTMHLPHFTFRGRIDTMTFTRVRFENISSYAFSNLAGSKSITFVGCDFIGIENEAFKRFSLETFSIIDSRMATILPSRAIYDVFIKTEFILKGVVFGHVHSSAFQIDGPSTFHMQNCYVKNLEGDAFNVRTQGTVIVDDNIFHSIDQGAFINISVDEITFQVKGYQEFIFENNTISEVERGALLFNVSSFRPKIDWIYFNTQCDCQAIHHWTSDVVLYSYHFPMDLQIPSNVYLDEIMSCKVDAPYMRLKDYSSAYCGPQSNFWVTFILGVMATILLILLSLLVYANWIHNQRSQWTNVPQTSPQHERINDTFRQQSPCYEEPSTSRQHIIVPDQRMYKETELQVIVECAEPQQEYTSRIVTEKMPPLYEPLEHRPRRYKDRQKRRDLLTSDL